MFIHYCHHFNNWANWWCRVNWYYHLTSLWGPMRGQEMEGRESVGGVSMVSSAICTPTEKCVCGNSGKHLAVEWFTQSNTHKVNPPWEHLHVVEDAANLSHCFSLSSSPPLVPFLSSLCITFPLPPFSQIFPCPFSFSLFSLSASALLSLSLIHPPRHALFMRDGHAHFKTLVYRRQTGCSAVLLH